MKTRTLKQIDAIVAEYKCRHTAAGPTQVAIIRAMLELEQETGNTQHATTVITAKTGLDQKVVRNGCLRLKDGGLLDGTVGKVPTLYALSDEMSTIINSAISKMRPEAAKAAQAALEAAEEPEAAEKALESLPGGLDSMPAAEANQVRSRLDALYSLRSTELTYRGMFTDAELHDRGFTELELQPFKKSGVLQAKHQQNQPTKWTLVQEAALQVVNNA